MCCHGPLSIVYKVACLITALSAICVGLREYGVDTMAKFGLMEGSPSLMYLHYIIGLAGLISLAKFVMGGYYCMTGKCKECKTR